MSTSRRAFLALNSAALGASLLPRGLLGAVESRSPPMPRLAGFYIASHPAPVRAAHRRLPSGHRRNPFLVVERGMFESQAENLQRKVRESVFNTPKEVDTAVAAVRTLAAV